MKGIIAGIIAGVAGAALWAVIAAFTGYEIGWIAWGIGAAVGAGVAWGSDGSTVTGVLAVVIAIGAIIGGKYVSVEMMLAKEVNAANEEIARQVEGDENYPISWLAQGVVYKLTEAGQTVEWPDEVNPEEATEEADFPPTVWSIAQEAWANMSDDEKADFKNEIQTQAVANVQDYASSVKKDGFIASFSAMDGIFFLLAIATAYKVGSKAD